MSLKYNNQIGKLHLFKPDYINDNKKSLIYSDIIKEYLMKKKGKKFYKIGYFRNKFISPGKDKYDIINRNIQLKIIQDSYQELVKQAKRRLILGKIKNNSEIKLLPDKQNKNKNILFFTPKNNSKNTFISVFYNSILFGYKRMEKIKEFRKIKSEENLELKNYENKLYAKEILSNLNNIIKNCGIKIDKNCKSQRIRKIYKYNEELNTNKKNDYNINNTKKNYDECNYLSLNQDDIIHTMQDIKKYLNQNSSQTDRNNEISNINNAEVKNENPYFLPNYKKEDKLKIKYNFFRMNPEKEDYSFTTQKFKKVKKILDSNKPLEIKKINPYYVYHFLNNIKNKNEFKISENSKEKSYYKIRNNDKYPLIKNKIKAKVLSLDKSKIESKNLSY